MVISVKDQTSNCILLLGVDSWIQLSFFLDNIMKLPLTGVQMPMRHISTFQIVCRNGQLREISFQSCLTICTLPRNWFAWTLPEVKISFRISFLTSSFIIILFLFYKRKKYDHRGVWKRRHQTLGGNIGILVLDVKKMSRFDDR